MNNWQRFGVILVCLSAGACIVWLALGHNTVGFFNQLSEVPEFGQILDPLKSEGPVYASVSSDAYGSGAVLFCRVDSKSVKLFFIEGVTIEDGLDGSLMNTTLNSIPAEVRRSFQFGDDAVIFHGHRVEGKRVSRFKGGYSERSGHILLELQLDHREKAIGVGRQNDVPPKNE